MQIYPTLQGETFPIDRRDNFSTIVQAASSGLEVRIAEYSYPLREWDIPYSWLSQDQAISDFQTLLGCFLAAYGKFNPLLYNDPYDNTTSPNPASPTPSIIATGDGTTTQFQIGRTLGGFFEPIYDINNTPNPPKIYLNSILTSA